MSVRHTVVASPVGPLTLVGDGTALIGLYFDGHLRPPRVTAPAPRGSAFEKQVWAMLTKIPYGETRTYGQLAAELGDPGAAQAVGNANGWNPISVIVPCHRVVGTSGGLTGYAGGLDRKRFLLGLEEPPADEVGRLF
ncbi:methylated-DNA--[protein]-cysteine S-methyltransferase [Amycolatopsis sp. RTGN1]|uniref:methylated-DNA--[protein]-cysteine S-methyltransferase n=1 Tax=Amycolatopsis ponsaeliensis TaxID=2992142 RepID=UPI002549CA26|nr:MGMT family protein [Amycolatopsis sp. RTGN1]